ncbi:MAG: pseudouridine synthase [Methylophilaceae bacterium]
MATIKLPENAAANSSAKAPTRRTDPSKRDRSSAAKKVIAPAREERQAREPNQKRSNSAAPLANAATKSSQRNHRFDGTPRQGRPEANAQDEVKPVEARSPQSSPAESRSSPARPTDKPPRDKAFSKPNVTSGESHYRQAPHRGGKLRDGFEPESKGRSSHVASAKPVPSNPDFPRLSKRMAELGLCSRREADEWITNGWVKVDGVVVDTLGSRIKPDAEIVISGYAKEYQSESVTILLHKPVGYVSGQAEDGYQPAIVLVHPDNQWQEDPDLRQKHPKQFQRRFLQGLAPAGRLDIDSTGLLVLTQDGRIARHLIGEESSVEKEYLVRVEGALSVRNLALLNHGLELDGVLLKPAKVSWQNEDQLRFVLREGRKRQIRRMCELVGLTVTGLKRVRIGSVNLGKLPEGSWRYLQEGERF